MPALSRILAFCKYLHGMINHSEMILFADFLIDLFYLRVFKFNDLITGNAYDVIMGISSDLGLISCSVAFKVMFGKNMAFIHQFQSLIYSCSGNVYVIILHLKVKLICIKMRLHVQGSI